MSTSSRFVACAFFLSIQYECICQPFLSMKYQHSTVYDKNELLHVTGASGRFEL